ncbi:hypothetical protein [Plantactinospora endophytica]|uniref:ESX secretion-associated protein EspG n=1 Tax=Plantactinospora endophytica TaxID=673535 RepID=A0ABQ4EEH3_9ACTN|nr:hypothetical protein [Plantactinospora endophytica]GIG93065.1 hypothetical protein Pen02_80010 [Plantactinospora endophytica]
MESANEGPLARRLVLSAPEWALLVRQTGMRPPPGLPVVDLEDAQVPEVAARLAARGVVTADGGDPLVCRPVEPVAVNLTTFVAARAVVQVEASVADRWTRALFAVAGRAGAGLVALADGGVQLSMFEAVTLGPELVRVVPAVRDLVDSEAARIGQALGGGPASSSMSGRLPVNALVEYGPAGELAGTVGRHRVVEALGLTSAQARLAEQVTSRATGVLRIVVSGRLGDGAGLAQVVWLATDEGWLGLHPDPDGSGRRMVQVLPVAREDIGVWLAPYLGQLLEDRDG